VRSIHQQSEAARDHGTRHLHNEHCDGDAEGKQQASSIDRGVRVLVAGGW